LSELGKDHEETEEEEMALETVEGGSFVRLFSKYAIRDSPTVRLECDGRPWHRGSFRERFWIRPRA
jgi:hypothetical protein